ncbi:hypothetical protein SADUNF_Sadunf16G0292900 [Salix dunnii]|uniref:Uncharacterized protein n=1 Tax=Salix dunnii TaxID=1413687 RepID=A0A835JE13_9ROSI|nr:hypothetical protein SADUNF_Sadunf16G0292900 [Salix dunnii]
MGNCFASPQLIKRKSCSHSPTLEIMDNTSGSKRVKIIVTKQQLQELLFKKISVEEIWLLGMQNVALCMGNCIFGGMAEGVIKVITSNGGILEFTTPITAGSITNEFPGHAIFPSHDLFWRPLSLQEELHGDYQGTLKRSYTEVFSRYNNNNKNKDNYYKSNNGFWKVKLAISPEQLVEILSQEASTEELIENVRAVAKCGNGFSSSASSVDFSDSWSLSSIRPATCMEDRYEVSKDGVIHQENQADMGTLSVNMEREQRSPLRIDLILKAGAVISAESCKNTGLHHGLNPYACAPFSKRA